MKKLFLGILSFVYLVMSGGVAMNLHYCMGRLNNIDYAYHDNDHCGKCGMKTANGCCHNEFKLIKVADDQQLTNKQAAVDQPIVLLPVSAIDLSKSSSGSCIISAVPCLSPPGFHQPAGYLLHCVFRV